ncbi:MAG TPA: DUF3320 domain-containing protein [Chloroflexota bacterium]|nr:DUF3320 domain-containing protein [Chloroflexota bacterium]
MSQYLDPARIHFDLVIFDEASQVLPEDAVGAIYRGDQLVVAGDAKQMPPTQFFQTGFDEASEEEEADGAPEVYESILDQCGSAGMRTAMLRWHYRSRDERLIAFSNHHFYDGRLITFPSPTTDSTDRGVRFVATPDGVYDRGGSRTNRIEARRIGDLVIAHAETRPEKSLGVVAFSQAQMLAILDDLELRRRQRPDLEPFFREDGSEPFFVKNLETVQGDERDVIFFSVGYGKDRTGKMTASFGPLNRAGGERRLNVAVTRARELVTFVSSIQPEDIDVSGTRSIGVRLLRQYMEFAIHGPSALDAGPATSAGPAESPFEESVAAELTKRGLVVQPQIGCAGFRIDLGVVHRDQPGRYILGIECDGATYHSSKTARDRDRLRQEVLEGLGWRIHRIWSADWVRDRNREVQRTLDALESAYRAADDSLSVAPPTSKALAVDVTDAPHVQRIEPSPTPPSLLTLATLEPPTRRAADQLKPYIEAQLPARTDTNQFYEPSAAALAIPSLVARSVREEGPVHVGRVSELIARSYGFQRIGERVAEQINRGIDIAVRQKRAVRRGDFLWPPDLSATDVPVRRSGPGGKPRAVDHVALEEIASALLLTLDECFSLPEEALIVQTARLLGYDRTGVLVMTRLKDAIATLERTGLVIRNDALVTRTASGGRHQDSAVGE